MFNQVLYSDNESILNSQSKQELVQKHINAHWCKILKGCVYIMNIELVVKQISESLICLVKCRIMKFFRIRRFSVLTAIVRLRKAPVYASSENGFKSQSSA